MFSISEGGIALLKIHISRKLHISEEKEREGQCVFKKYGDNALSLKGTQINIAKKDLIRKHEIIRALKGVKSNRSFSSTNDDSKIFKETFPDLETAKQYQQCETEPKCTIQYGIYPFLKDLFPDDIKNVAFTFKFDESTTQQVKKQYDSYIQYLSQRYQCIKISYFETIMVDHCPTEKLLEHFLEFVDKVNHFQRMFQSWTNQVAGFY